MPSLRSSPPLRLARSPDSLSSQTVATPPIPNWDPRRSKTSSPQRPIPLAPPVPPLPPSPVVSSFSSLILPPSESPDSISRSSSSSSSSSQPVFTPRPRSRSRTGKNLLPALPLSSNIQHTPIRSKRVAVDYSCVPSESVQIIISREEGRLSTFPSNVSSPQGVVTRNDTPPRPARRSRRISAPSLRHLSITSSTEPAARQSIPRPLSPSNDSASTILDIPTPRPNHTQDRDEARVPETSQSLVSVTNDLASAPMARKRDSAQRRLSALRGLVANLDFNQPWSTVEAAGSCGGYFWACGDPQESDESVTEGVLDDTDDLVVPTLPISPPMPLILDAAPIRPRLRRMTNAAQSQDHGWDSPKSDRSPHIEITPVRISSILRVPNSTPPRRPKQFRPFTEGHRTPEPPRPALLRRKEVFEVASSGYSKCHEPASSVLPTTPTSTWRSSLASEEAYAHLMQTHGQMEIKRQEVMWEMSETEHAFVKSMRTVLRLFAIPLKTPQGKWIDGIPERITELFDSLERVAHAHGIVSAAQRDMRRRAEVLDVAAFVSLFKGWISRLQVHEFYLLRFEAVVQLVEDKVQDPESVFGEFVRMQMKEEVLGSMSLGSMLLKPVQRLTKYPLFLKRLLDVTPHPHAGQPDILSLLSSIESIILTLQSTKAREEDFEQVQSLGLRLHGLPEGFTLAVRGRKLIGQGQVCRVLPGKDVLPGYARGRAGSLHSSRGSISSSVSSSAPSSASSSSPWDFSASLTSSTCRTSGFSVSSTSSFGCPSSRTGSIVQTSPSVGNLSAVTSPTRPLVIRSPSSTSSFCESRPPTPSSARSFKRKEDVYSLFIFDDLVIVASYYDKSSLFGSGRKNPDKSWRVLAEAEGGIGKVAEVKDWSGWNGERHVRGVS